MGEAYQHPGFAMHIRRAIDRIKSLVMGRVTTKESVGQLGFRRARIIWGGSARLPDLRATWHATDEVTSAAAGFEPGKEAQAWPGRGVVR